MSQAEWQFHSIYTRDDGSYVVTLRGCPCHVPPEMDEFTALWAEVDAWAKAHPEAVQPEPGPPPPTPEEEARARVAAIEAELTALDARSARAMRALLAGTGTEEDQAYLADLESRAAALRRERAVAIAAGVDAAHG